MCIVELQMDRYFKRLASESHFLSNSRSENSPSTLGETQHTQNQASQVPLNHNPSTQRSRVDVSTLPSDPADRIPISNYDVNDRDEIRRAYIQRGPYQPHKKSYPQTLKYGSACRFKEEWYFKYSNWLEYSPKNDACYCLFCYLFASESETSSFQGGEAFTRVGFRTWNNIKRFNTHIGGVNIVLVVKHP